MRVAFYAPLKSPTHPHPSGDRRMARLLMRALRRAGHEVRLASSFRSYDRAGDAAVQAELAAAGSRIAERLVRRWKEAPRGKRPQVWFTYHLYHKAPDHLGPVVSASLRIPYVVAEASVAPKRRDGPWARGYAAALAALRRADAALCLNPVDPECVRPALRRDAMLAYLPPFLVAGPYVRAAERRERCRAALADRLPTREPWLLTVGMMRPGDKLDSYRVLGRALTRIADRRWRLIVVGDGVARAETKACLAEFGNRVLYLGIVPAGKLPAIYAACDLYVWPAVREAYGMAILEAQAAGLPVVAGFGVGVDAIVSGGGTGLLVRSDDDAALAHMVETLLDDPARRATMRDAARAKVRSMHDIDAAAEKLNDVLRRVTQRRRG